MQRTFDKVLLNVFLISFNILALMFIQFNGFIYFQENKQIMAGGTIKEKMVIVHRLLKSC
jgi:hypothetical protein